MKRRVSCAPEAKVVLGPVTAADYDGLVALWKASGLTYRPRGRDGRRAIARQLRHPTAIYIKATAIEGRRRMLVGAVLGSHDGRRGWINRLAVLPGYRRRGVAGLLVRALERRLGALGLLVWAVQVDKGNRGSLAFFRALGYLLHDDIHYLSKRKGPWC
jgi:ribosomal protein S18 acetylase RimI-like enzyme